MIDSLKTIVETLQESESQAGIAGEVSVGGTLYNHQSSVRFWRNPITKKRGHTITITLDFDEKY